MEYYYLNEGKTEGPFSQEQLLALYESNVITAETLISSPGDTAWRPLKNKLGIVVEQIERPATFSNITTPNGLSIWQCYKRCLEYYATFSGRATRKEYWSFNLINIFAHIIGASIFLALLYPYMAAQRQDIEMGVPVGAIVIAIIGFLVSIVLVVPGFAVTWRRLHDAGFSGWFFLLNFIPCVGGLIGLIFTLLDSTKGDNAYGPSEKYPQ